MPVSSRPRDAIDDELDRVFDGPPVPLGGRPTEVVSGVGLLGSVYGALTQAGMPPEAAAVLAVAAAVVPWLVSTIVDAWRARAHR